MAIRFPQCLFRSSNDNAKAKRFGGAPGPFTATRDLYDHLRHLDSRGMPRKALKRFPKFSGELCGGTEFDHLDELANAGVLSVKLGVIDDSSCRLATLRVKASQNCW